MPHQAMEKLEHLETELAYHTGPLETPTTMEEPITAAEGGSLGV